MVSLGRESPPRVSELARLLGLRLNSFVETFHSAAGTTPSGYLKRRQVDAARLLLFRATMTVDRVGYAAGFGTRRTFFRAFRKHTGLSPALYRKRVRNGPSFQKRD
ncbi:MAG: helix-turn-helix domain-containing protein [Thermoanaerobaculia bacterium]